MIKLSVLIPCYNYKKGLIKILNDFISCNPKDLNSIEIIIGDDSKKNLLSVNEIKHYKSYIPNLNYIYNNRNLYINNWNNLISLAKGEFYWLLHHDEIIKKPITNLHNIICLLNKKNDILVLPIHKYKSFKIIGLDIKLTQLQTANKSLIKFFLNNSKLFLYINLIGSPSSLIIRKEIKIFYNDKLQWLVDVDFYYRLFKKINAKYINIVNPKQVVILSDQNYKDSITNKKKLDSKAFNKLKIKELELLERLNNIEDNFKMIIILSWIIYKLFLCMNLKFTIKRSN